MNDRDRGDWKERLRDPLIAREHAAYVAAVLTAIGGIFAYFIAGASTLDGRIDKLEESIRILIDEQGMIRPSKEALQTYFHTQDLDRRIDRLESKHDRLKD